MGPFLVEPLDEVIEARLSSCLSWLKAIPTIRVTSTTT